MLASKLRNGSYIKLEADDERVSLGLEAKVGDVRFGGQIIATSWASLTPDEAMLLAGHLSAWAQSKSFVPLHHSWSERE